MKIGDLVRYRKDLEPHLRKGFVNKPALVIEVTPPQGVTDATALVLTSRRLIRRRYQWELGVISESG